MPSKSPAQRRTMAAAAHNPEFAKKVGIPTSVAKEFNRADQGKKEKAETPSYEASKHSKSFLAQALRRKGK